MEKLRAKKKALGLTPGEQAQVNQETETAVAQEAWEESEPEPPVAPPCPSAITGWASEVSTAPLMGQSWSLRSQVLGSDVREAIGDGHASPGAVPLGIVSPYTGRVLTGLVWRDRESIFDHVRLMTEVVYEARRRASVSYGVEESNGWIGGAYRRAPIDYTYLAPWMLPQLHEGLAEAFWPGIDLTDWLATPDYTIVAVYRRVVVGLAALSPDGYLCFLWTAPGLWRRGGVGKVLLWMATQILPPGRDVTLHVGADNDAALALYTSFGFIPESKVIDHFRGYIPPDRPGSLDAWFLRLPSESRV